MTTFWDEAGHLDRTTVECVRVKAAIERRVEDLHMQVLGRAILFEEKLERRLKGAPR